MEPSHMTVMLINSPPWKDPPPQIMFLFRWTKKRMLFHDKTINWLWKTFPCFIILNMKYSVWRFTSWFAAAGRRKMLIGWSVLIKFSRPTLWVYVCAHRKKNTCACLSAVLGTWRHNTRFIKGAKICSVTNLIHKCILHLQIFSENAQYLFEIEKTE